MNKPHSYKKLTNAQKRDLAFHEGALVTLSTISYMIDNLIIEKCRYRENDKLMRLRDKVLTRLHAENKVISEIKLLKQK